MKTDTSLKVEAMTKHEYTTRDDEMGVSLLESNLQTPETEASFEKDSIFRADRRVMESEIPDLVICYKDSTHDFVKDICIDEAAVKGLKANLGKKKLCNFFVQNETEDLSFVDDESADVDSPVHTQKLEFESLETGKTLNSSGVGLMDSGCVETLSGLTHGTSLRLEDRRVQLLGSSIRVEDGHGLSISDHLQYVNGEASFSSLGHESCLVSYSGPMADPGSVSLRSESSATSARSFAFPVLQSDWNTSPVRMAKADRRQLRRHWWRHNLLCCRF